MVNDIIADSDGNITGILVHIPSNLESLINISNLEFKEFLRTRIDDFNPEFIETHGFTPERYREKYIRDMKVLRKVIL